MIEDAELAAWYGSGLHAPKAMRLIDEVRELKEKLAQIDRLCGYEWDQWKHGLVPAIRKVIRGEYNKD